jgi:hypothetical protein
MILIALLAVVANANHPESQQGSKHADWCAEKLQKESCADDHCLWKHDSHCLPKQYTTKNSGHCDGHLQDISNRNECQIAIGLLKSMTYAESLQMSIISEKDGSRPSGCIKTAVGQAIFNTKITGPAVPCSDRNKCYCVATCSTTGDCNNSGGYGDSNSVAKKVIGESCTHSTECQSNSCSLQENKCVVARYIKKITGKCEKSKQIQSKAECQSAVAMTSDYQNDGNLPQNAITIQEINDGGYPSGCYMNVKTKQLFMNIHSGIGTGTFCSLDHPCYCSVEPTASSETNSETDRLAIKSVPCQNSKSVSECSKVSGCWWDHGLPVPECLSFEYVEIKELICEMFDDGKWQSVVDSSECEQIVKELYHYNDIPANVPSNLANSMPAYCVRQYQSHSTLQKDKWYFNQLNNDVSSALCSFSSSCLCRKKVGAFADCEEGVKLQQHKCQCDQQECVEDQVCDKTTMEGHQGGRCWNIGSCKKDQGDLVNIFAATAVKACWCGPPEKLELCRSSRVGQLPGIDQSIYCHRASSTCSYNTKHHSYGDAALQDRGGPICPAAKYSQSNNCVDMTIKSCASGKAFVSNSADIDIENWIGAQENDGKCELCPEGWVQGQQGRYTCKQCGPGKWADTNNQLSCIKCKPGSFLNNHGGKRAETLESPCHDCQKGSYNSEEGQGKCKVCDGGRYTNVTGLHTVCEDCPIGRHLTDKSTSIERRHLHDDILDCLKCAVFTYNPIPGQKSACFPCATAKTMGEYTCSGCDPGLYKHVHNTTYSACIVCPAGYFTDERDLSSCGECQRGTYNDRLSRKECQKCPRGKYNGDIVAAKNKESCLNCTKGRYSADEGVSNPTEQRAGIFFYCNGCPAGKWSDQVGVSKESGCYDCNAGKYSDKIASPLSLYCFRCETGKFSEIAGLTDINGCNDCPAGKHQNEPGKTFCLPCNKGKMQPSVGAVECNKCPKNYAIDEVQSYTCKSCLSGQYTRDTGAAECSSCSGGRFGKGCLYCPVGYKRSDGEPTDQCTLCGLGETSYGNGSTSCQKCELGRYGIYNGTCENCQVGRFADGKGSVKCSFCTHDRIPNEKQTSCVKPEWKLPSDCDVVTQYLNVSHKDFQFWKCSPCPLGASCVGDITWKNVTAKYGWWRLREDHQHQEQNQKEKPPSCLADQTMSLPSCAFVKCHNPHACFGARNSGQHVSESGKDPSLFDRPEGCNVKDGYQQWCSTNISESTTLLSSTTSYMYLKNKTIGAQRCRLCATCANGYKRAGGGSTTCKKCPPKATNRLLLGLGIALMFIGLAVMTYTTIRAEGGGRGGTTTTIKKILLNFSQIISLASSLPLRWPTSITQMFDTYGTVSSVGSNLLIPDCELSHLPTAEAFYLKQLFYALSVPLIVMCTSFIWFFVGCYLTSCRPKKAKRLKWSKVKDYTIMTIVLMLFLCYPMLTRLSLSMLKCQPIGDAKYLYADVEETCFVGRHQAAVLLLTVPQLILYVIGLPLASLSIVIRNRNILQTDKTIRLRYGLLYRGYGESYSILRQLSFLFFFFSIIIIIK